MPRINAEYRKTATKKIIQAAIDVAVENGWNALTLDAIAKKLNISKGTLYVYFENSEALHREVIFEVLRKLRTNLLTIFKKNKDIHYVILEMADLIFEKQKPYAVIFCQIPLKIPIDAEYQSEFVSYYDQNVHVISEFLTEMKEKGTISSHVKPESAANVILALTMGLRIKTLFLGRDTHEAKMMWIETVACILLSAPDNVSKIVYS